MLSHLSITIFDAEQVHLKLEVTILKIKEITTRKRKTLNPKP